MNQTLGKIKNVATNLNIFNFIFNVSYLRIRIKTRLVGWINLFKHKYCIALFFQYKVYFWFVFFVFHFREFAIIFGTVGIFLFPFLALFFFYLKIHASKRAECNDSLEYTDIMRDWERKWIAAILFVIS